MKNLIFFIVVLVLLVTITHAQRRLQKGGKHRGYEKIEQLEKIKLIEILKMDEETTLRFFSRRAEHQEEHRSLNEKKFELINELENYLTGKEALPEGETYKSTKEKIFTLERKLLDSRFDFVNSLKDMLSDEQIAKLVVFGYKFKQEIRDLILKRRDDGAPPRR